MSRPTAAPPRPAAPPRWGRGGAVLCVAAALAACGGAEGGPQADEAETAGRGPAVDSALVDVLAEVALAESRAALSADTSGRGGASADSLRTVALGAHGLDADALDRRLDALARDPGLAEATYAAVADRLRRERRGTADGDAPF